MASKKRIAAALMAVLVAASGLTVMHVRRALGPALQIDPACREDPRQGWLIRDVTVFDSRTGRNRVHQDVYFDHGQSPNILAMGATGTVLHSTAQVIDGTGHTLLPGFVNAHVHALSPVGTPWAPIFPDANYNLDAWLAAGVTTVFDLGGPTAQLSSLSKQLEQGEVLGPHLVHGDAMITVPGAHPLPAARAMLPWPVNILVSKSLYVVEDETSARKAVQQIAATGAPWVKAIRDELPQGAELMHRRVLNAVVEEARAQGVKSVVHVGTEADAKLAVEADLQAHMVYRGALRDDIIKALQAMDTVVVPTADGFEATADLFEGSWTPTDWDRALHPRELLDPLIGDAGKAIAQVPVIGDFAAEVHANRHQWKRTLGAMDDLGVTLLVGTDAPLPGVLPGSAYHREIDRMLAAGIPIEHILQSATYHAARFLQEPVQFGVVEAGLRADLILVEGDPTVDPAAIHHVREVFLSGQHLARTADRVP